MGYILAGTIIGGIVWGIVVNKVVENKGYEENWFWWGFFFGFFALIVALTKQNVNTTKVVIAGTSQPEEKSMEVLSTKTLNERVNISSPVHITSWEIKKDTEKLVLFVDFINVSHKEISAVMFSAMGFNVFGDKVLVNDVDFFDVIGQDLTVKPNEYGKIYTILQDDAIRKVEVRVKKICFADGTIVDDIPENWINTNQNALSPIHTECAKRENSEAKYYSIIEEEYWQCVCGFVNSKNDCVLCGMQKGIALKFAQENFANTYSEYLGQIETERIDEKMRRLEEERLKEERRTRAKKNKKTIIIVAPIIVVIAILIVVLNIVIFPIIDYNKAKHFLEEGNVNEAIVILEGLGKFDELKSIAYNKAEEEYHSENIEGAYFYYTKAKGYSDSAEKLAEIRAMLGRNNISAGWNYTVGLKKDGTVLAVGNNYFGQHNDMGKWTDIVAVTAGNNYTVGLKDNGVVVAVGAAGDGQCDVDEWTDVVAICAGDLHTVGLKKDGTVLAVGENHDGQCDVDEWTDIVAISAGSNHTVGLKYDGTVVAVGAISDGQCDVNEWTDIVAICAGDLHTVGLKKDGTVLAVGNNYDGRCNVSEWTDIMAVSAGGDHTIGLKYDGTVVAVGAADDGQCDVSEWTDIVAISAGNRHTVGLKKDGKVRAIGNNYNGQCDVENWDLFK